MAHTANAACIADGFVQRPTQRDPHILHEVVPAGVQVTLGVECYVDQPVAGKLADHVVEEPVTGVDIICPGAVEVYVKADVGLAGGAMEGSAAAIRDGGQDCRVGHAYAPSIQPALRPRRRFPRAGRQKYVRSR